jgi:hypothetical protein
LYGRNNNSESRLVGKERKQGEQAGKEGIKGRAE